MSSSATSPLVERARSRRTASPALPAASTKGTLRVRIAAYTRVSTTEQATDGAGLDAQAHAILSEAERRGWPPVCLYTDAGLSGKAIENRAALQEAIALVESQRGSVLVVAKLDRLTRSLRDFADILDRSRRRGWVLICLDLNVDTSSPSGEMLASVVATVAQYERRLIGVRTREAMAAHKRAGIRYGRSRGVPEGVRRYIVRLRTGGRSLRQIANRLNERSVPTGQGGTEWRKSAVAVVLSYGTLQSSEHAFHPGPLRGRSERVRSIC